MKPLQKRKPLSVKQKTFVREYLSNNMVAKSAAAKAGYSDPKNSAACLLRNENVKKEINKLQEKDRKKYNISRARLAEEYDEVIKLAKKKGQCGPMATAIAGKARLFGLETTKHEVSGRFDVLVKEIALMLNTKDLSNE